jgi:hypothetical protein
MAIEYNNDPYGIIIPCAEIARFYYCRSSDLSPMKLFNQLEDMENTISNNNWTEKFKLLFRKDAMPLLLVLAFVLATVMNFSLQLAELL